MSENCQQPICCRPDDLHNALAIHTRKITDSCRDKDCIEDLRVYLTRESQEILENASNAKVRSAELLYVSVNVSPVGFRPNHYSIDLVFYYHIIADAMTGPCRPTAIYGAASFAKRAILCGEVSTTHVFSNDQPRLRPCGSDNMPRAVVEALDPIVLASRVCSSCPADPGDPNFPEPVRRFFEDELVTGSTGKRLYVTLSQFSVIRLERPAQLIVPVLDYSIPTRQCCESPGCTENPCELFARIPFPTEEFAPADCDCDRPS